MVVNERAYVGAWSRIVPSRKQYRRYAVYTLNVLLVLLFFYLVYYIKKPPRVAFVPYDFNHTLDSTSRTNENLLIGVHITDTHASVFKPKTIERFDELLDLVEEINPDFVIHTGDMIEAKRKNSEVMTQQNLEEWKVYRRLLQSHKMDNESFFYDINGNHDLYTVRGLDSSNSYYWEYSSQREKYKRLGKKRAYYDTVRYSGNTLNIITLELTPEKQPGIPLGFEGFTDKNLVRDLKEFVPEPKSERATNFHTIAIGHYPTTYVHYKDNTEADFYRELLRLNTSILFDGHSHANGMYNIHHNGLIELELASFIDQRKIRIFIIDSGLFSFADFNMYKDEVFFVPTHPKSAVFLSKYDPVPNDKDGYLRVFAGVNKHSGLTSEIDTVEFYDKKTRRWVEMSPATDGDKGIMHLYYHPDYDRNIRGVGKICFRVTLENGMVKYFKHHYSLDGTRKGVPPTYTSVLLAHNMHTVGLGLFFIGITIGVVLNNLDFFDTGYLPARHKKLVNGVLAYLLVGPVFAIPHYEFTGWGVSWVYFTVGNGDFRSWLLPILYTDLFIYLMVFPLIEITIIHYKGQKEVLNRLDKMSLTMNSVLLIAAFITFKITFIDAKSFYGLCSIWFVFPTLWVLSRRISEIRPGKMWNGIKRIKVSLDDLSQDMEELVATDDSNALYNMSISKENI